MSLNKKLNEVAQLVCDRYPELKLNDVTVAHSCVNDICNSVFGRMNANKIRCLKNTVANALNRENSKLRTRIATLQTNNCNDTLVSLNDSKLTIKISHLLNKNMYGQNAFKKFNITLIDDLCRQLKLTINGKNRNLIFRNCRNMYEDNSFLSTIVMDMASNSTNTNLVVEESVISTNNINSKFNLTPLNHISVNVSSIEPNVSFTAIDENILYNTNREVVDDMSDMTSVNFENVINSTPVSKKYFKVTPVKESNEKYKPVESPLKDALMKRTPVKAGVVLPPGTENTFPCILSYRKDNFKKFSGCTYKEGEFLCSKQEWSLIENVTDDGIIYYDTRKCPVMFRKRVKTVNNTCVINVHSVNYPKQTFSYVYMYCCHPGCKSFKLVIEPQIEGSVLVSVWSSSLNFHHDPEYALTNFVRGIERDLVRAELKNKRVFAYDNEAIKSSSPSKHARGNNQIVKSVDVLRKIRSEALSASDYDRDDMIDLFKRYSENSNYVKHVGLPSYVHVYSQEQLRLLTDVKTTNKETITGYLDATGTVVRKVSDNSKRVLYYAIVINARLPGNSSVTCPIVEMVSSSHDIVAISQWLNAFKAFAIKNKHGWPLFSNVVTDFSYAQMHALSIGWNGFSSIFDYLDWCYSVLIENKNVSKVTIVNVCVNHYTKIIVNHVYTYFKVSSDAVKPKDVKKVNNCIIDWICLLFNMDTIQGIIYWFNLFATILLSRTKTPEVEFALNVLQDKCKDNFLPLNENEVTEGFVSEQDFCKFETSKSKLYYMFHRIKEEIKSLLICNSNHSTELNEYFSEEYLESFLLKCVPFMPLWTPVMNNKVSNGVLVRQSNATVESWFKTVKKDLLCDNRRLKCGRFVDELRNRVLNICNQVNLGIRKKRCTRVLYSNQVPGKKVMKEKSIILDCGVNHKNISGDQTFLNSVEEWGKKEKQPRHLQPISYRPFGKSQCQQTTDCTKGLISESMEAEKIKLDDNIINSYKAVVNCSSSSGTYKTPFIVVPSKEMKLYSNMLPKDLTYYKNVKMPKTSSYFVGTYEYLYSDNKRKWLFNKYLTISDFDRLTGNRWLNNFVIDVCLTLKVFELGLKNVEVLPCEIVVSLLEKKYYGEFIQEKIAITENSTVILPWNVNGNHWIVVIIDFCTNKCTIMDPINPVDVNNRMSENRFKHLCKELKSSCVYGDRKEFPTLTLVSCTREHVPEQTDTYNCGVFIIYYVFTVLSKLNFDHQFNPSEYRIFLKHFLLQHSDNVNDMCLYCNRLSEKHDRDIDDSAVTWVSCSKCCRWIVTNCIPEEDRLDNYESNDFYCLLCK